MDQDSIGLSDQLVVDPFAGLTTKQREVLDLLIEYKTSKEISRLLGISPHTVDQRILLARAKLGVATRSQVAQAYRRLLAEHARTYDPGTYQRSIYGSPGLVMPAGIMQDRWQEDHEAVPSGDLRDHPEKLPSRAMFLPVPISRIPHHVLPEACDGRVGWLMRLGVIAILAMFLVLVMLGAMAVFSQLSQMLDG